MINQQRVMEILNKGNNNDQWSLMCDRFLATLIIINLLGICLESVNLFATNMTRNSCISRLFQ